MYSQKQKEILFSDISFDTNKEINESDSISEEDGYSANIKRWRYLWRYRIGPNGNMETGSKLMQKYYQNSKQNRIATCDPQYDNGVIWENLGPFNSDGALTNSSACTGNLPGIQNQGRVKCISVNPNNENDIVLGAANGGIWRSLNGGQTWFNVSDDDGLSQFGLHSITRHPADPSILYASTNAWGGLWEQSRAAYSTGVIISTDNGETWNLTGLVTSRALGRIVVDPNSTLNNTKIYVVDENILHSWKGNFNASGSWLDEYVDWTWHNGPLWKGTVGINDVAVDQNGEVWFTTFEGLWRGQNSNYTKVNNYTIPAGFDTYNSGCVHDQVPARQHINLEINNQGHMVMLVAYLNLKKPLQASSCKENDKRFIYRSTDLGNSWSPPKDVTQDSYKDTRNNSFPMLAVSPNNSDVIYIENRYRCINKSTDFGTTFSTTNNQSNHVDIRDILAISGSGTDDHIYLGTDGGISKTTDGQNWVDITGEGLSIALIYGLGIDINDDNRILTGCQDGSVNYYVDGQWWETDPYADNGDCLISPNPSSNKIVQEQQHTIKIGSINGTAYSETASHGFSGTWMNPLFWNPANNQEFYIGAKKLYVKDINGSLTQVPTNLHNDKDISSVVACRSNPNIIYYSTDGIVGAPPYDNNDDGIFKVVRNGSSFSVTRINNNLNVLIHGKQGLAEPITDIAVDPNDENRLWITFGGFNSSKKVFKSTDGGQFWQNITNTGLPNFPCTAIAYQELTNDRLYVGTDVGVFYMDDDTGCWAKYGNNNPPCMITDMEINGCAQKLLVSSYGRGLWEAPLLQWPAYKLPTGTTTWNQDKSITGNVTIPSGAKLIINNSTINIGKDIKIIVETGGKLEINNSTLTNLCGKNWWGIEVKGNTNLSQSYSNQGVVICDNSTIEHANEAIASFNGGIIKSNDSYFYNNKRSISFSKYNYGNNDSYFDNSYFETNTDYRFSNSLLAHFTMWGVKNIKITGCEFNNYIDWSFSNRVGGIVSTDASFEIDRKCIVGTSDCAYFKKTEFRGLNRAVEASRTTGSYTYSIYNSIFENNVYGIISNAVNFFQIRNNHFTVGKSNISFSPSEHEGITINSGYAFIVDQNLFNTSFSSVHPTTIGIRVNSLGFSNNEIYNNEFIKSTAHNQNEFYGNLANGLNGSQTSGLKYRCNKNSGNTRNGYDFAVASGTIARYQGSSSSSPSNKFSLGTSVSGAPLGSDFFNDGADNVRYYFANPAEEPINTYNVSTYSASNSYNCVDRYSPNSSSSIITNGNSGGALSLSILKAMFMETKSKRDSIEVQLGSSIDTMQLIVLNQEMDDLVKKALHLILAQKNISYTDYAEWLLLSENTDAKLQLIDYYINNDQINRADDLIKTLPKDIGDIQDFISLKNIQMSYKKNKLDIDSLDDYSHEIKDVFNRSSGLTNFQARSILNLNGYHYFNEPILPKYLPESRLQSKSSVNNRIKVSPNPASTLVSFQLQHPIEGSIMRIYNTEGSLVYTTQMGKDGSAHWNCTDAIPGIYFYIIFAESFNTSGKIVVDK